MRLFKSKSKEIKEFQSELPEPPKPEAKKEEANLKLPEIKKPVEEKPIAKASPPPSPPLFIKVDRYKEIIRTIDSLRSYILNLRDALDVLRDMQKEIANGIEIAQKTLDDLNSTASELDTLFMKPKAPERDLYEKEIFEERSGELEDSMQNLYRQLEKLRTQIKAIS